MRKKIKAVLCNWFPRYKLRCILRALKLDARPWQIEFALCQSNYMPTGRCTGKTVAIMLRALMVNPKKIQGEAKHVILWSIMRGDPDYTEEIYMRRVWYRSEYDRYSRRCKAAGIPVPETLFTARSADWGIK